MVCLTESFLLSPVWDFHHLAHQAAYLTLENSHWVCFCKEVIGFLCWLLDPVLTSTIIARLAQWTSELCLWGKKWGRVTDRSGSGGNEPLGSGGGRLSIFHRTLSKNEDSRASCREVQSWGLNPGRGYSEASGAIIVLQKNIPSWATGLVSGRMKLFMVEKCWQLFYTLEKGIRHNLRGNEKYDYFRDYLPSLASQECPLSQVCGLCPCGCGGWNTILGTASSNSQLGCVHALECMEAVIQFGFLLWNDTWSGTVR